MRRSGRRGREFESLRPDHFSIGKLRFRRGDRFRDRRIQANEPIDAELAVLLLNHANMHFQQLQQKNPDQATQLEQLMQQMAQYLGQVVAKEQQVQPTLEEAVPVERITND